MPGRQRQSPTTSRGPAPPPVVTSAPASSAGRRRGPSKASSSPESAQRPSSVPAQSHHGLRSRSRGGPNAAGPSTARQAGPLNANARVNGHAHSRRATSGSTQTSFDDAASTSVSGLSLTGGDDEDRLTSISSIDLGKDDACVSDEETFTYQSSTDAQPVDGGNAEPSDEEETFVYRPSKLAPPSPRPSLLPAATIEPTSSYAFTPPQPPHAPFRPAGQTSFAPRTSPFLAPVQHGASSPYRSGPRGVGSPAPMMPVGGPGYGMQPGYGPSRGPPLMGPGGGMVGAPPPVHPLFGAPMTGPPPMLASFLEENAKRKRNVSSVPAYQPLPSAGRAGSQQMSPVRSKPLPAPQTTPGGSAWPTFQPFDPMPDPPTPVSLVGLGGVDARQMRSLPMWQDESPGGPAAAAWTGGASGSNGAPSETSASWSPASAGAPIGKRMRLDPPSTTGARVLPPPSTMPVW